MNYGIYFEITFNWRWIITGNPIEFFNSRKVKEEVKICSENLSFTIIDIDNSIINTNDKSQTPDHSLIPISQKSCNSHLQFQKQFQKRKTTIPTSIFLPFRFARIPIKIQGGCMSIAPLIIHVSSFFFPSGNHTRCLSSPRAKGCRNAVVNAAYLPLNCESCECKSGSLSLSLSPPIHVVVVNWHDFAVLPHLAPWLSGSSINKCMSVSILLHPPPPAVHNVFDLCMLRT